MRKTIIISVVMLLLIFTSGLASAGYITLFQKYVGIELTNSSSYEFNFANAYQLQDNLYIEATFDNNYASSDGQEAHMYIYLSSDTIDIYTRCYDYYSDDYYVIVKLNGQEVYDSYDYYSGYSTNTRFKKIVAYMANATTMKIEIYDYNENLMSGTPVEVSLSSSTLQQIKFTTTTSHVLKINSIYIKRNSTLLDTLNVYDEDSLSLITEFDFSESNDTITIYASGYAPRTYFVDSSSLDAFLAQYGRYYGITVANAGSGILVEALRDYGGSKKVVAQAKTDETGKTSMFLMDSKIYTFRVHYPDNATMEWTKVSDPTNPNIYLGSTITGGIQINEGQLPVLVRWYPSNSTIEYGDNMQVQVDIAVRDNNMQNATLTLYDKDGKQLIQEILQNSPSGGTIKAFIPSTTSNVIDASLVVVTTNQTYNFTKKFSIVMHREGLNVESTMEQAKGAFGFNDLGALIAAILISLMIANAVGAGSGGAIFIMFAVFMFFAYEGWLDWRFAALGILAGVGIMIRRGEA